MNSSYVCKEKLNENEMKNEMENEVENFYNNNKIHYHDINYFIDIDFNDEIKFYEFDTSLEDNINK
jgi:hypothetical protein